MSQAFPTPHNPINSNGTGNRQVGEAKGDTDACDTNHGDHRDGLLETVSQVIRWRGGRDRLRCFDVLAIVVVVGAGLDFSIGS